MKLEFGSRRRAEDVDAELVVGADGVSSATRAAAPAMFGTQVETGEGLYLWAGADFALEHALFAPVRTEHGTFVTHLQDAFAEHLHGHHLIGNRTRWLRFRTVRCRQWHHGRVVLLGDAAHTAHYSVGSGTKLAMEDAIALVDALA